MALNFPSNTTLPYVDPVSGLKYIYNDTVGAWEAAIQPPAIVASNPPAITIPGFLWWDDVGGSLYIYYKDADSEQWVEAVPSPASKVRSAAAMGVNPPDAPTEGEFWWDTANGRLYVWYVDIDGGQWMQSTPAGSGFINPSSVGMTLHSGGVEPTAFKRGDLWFNTSENTLYAHVSGAWKKAHNIVDPSSFVTGITGGTGLTVSGTATQPVITPVVSSTTVSGVVRLSTGTEGTAAADKTTALSPGVLKETISSYVDISTLATKAEVAAVNTADPLPVGTIIEFAGSTPPTGYLATDGSLVSRVTYAALFQVIGTTYGIGDGATTFKLPTKTGDYTCCIKF